MEYTLRTAIPSDAARINELFTEMLHTIDPTGNAEGYEAGYLDKFFSGGEDRILAAETESEVIAFLSVEVYRRKGYVYLDDFSVAAEYRSQGIGTALLRAAEAYAVQLGIAGIRLHVERSNTAAYRFYRRHGFSELHDEGSRVLMAKGMSDMSGN